MAAIASYTTSQKVAEELQLALQPEYDIVHVSTTADAALAELPALASGNTDIVPSSGLGSNANADPSARQVPKAIIIGGVVPAEEIEEVKAAVSAAAPNVKSISVTQEEVEAAGGPSTDIIAAILKQKLAEAGI